MTIVSIAVVIIVVMAGFALVRSAGGRKVEDGRFMAVMISLSSLVELKDRYTEGHCARVRKMVSGICEKLGLSDGEIKDILVAATLHDIGKVGVSDGVLGKPAPLDEMEYREIRKHPDFGASSVVGLEDFGEVARIIRHHHETFDGKGYPAGLSGKDIPLGSRIIAVADAFDAMTSDRAYRKAKPVESALAILKEEKGRQFDPEIVDALLEVQRLGGGIEADPVCGMRGNPEKKAVYRGRTVHFCSDPCKAEFERSPEKYFPLI